MSIAYAFTKLMGAFPLGLCGFLRRYDFGLLNLGEFLFCRRTLGSVIYVSLFCMVGE